jgi:hypothetical protein
VRTHARLVAVAAVACLSLAACGGTASSQQSTDLELSLLPSADAFTSAVVATRSMGTAHESIDVQTAAPSRHDRRTGDGPTVLSSGWGDVTWTADGRRYRELVNDRGTYVQSDPPTGDWALQPVGGPTLTSGYLDSLRDLGVLRDVTNEGSDTTPGVPTTRYSGWLPLDATEAALLGLTTADLATIPEAPNARQERVTAWVDDFGHVIRVDRRVLGATADLVRSTTSLDEFSLLLDLSSPTDAVTTALQ